MSDDTVSLEVYQSVVQGRQAFREAYQRELVRVRDLERVLRSIAGNTCCDKCQEAALVAKHAIETIIEPH